MRIPSVFTSCTLLICAITALPLATVAQNDRPVDTRKVYSSASPAWLRAVGKLRVPGSVYREGQRAHLQEDCSATLVTGAPGRPADIVITAWHCLANYNDLSKAITFTLVNGGKGSSSHEAFRLADGGGMHGDWAILRLHKSVDAGLVTALLIQPGRADASRDISMAGYSRDRGVGNGGRQLTFDPACTITLQSPDTSGTDCLAHKGASGGAVVQRSAAGTVQYSGVVSEGNGSGVSTFVPVSRFRTALNQYLE